MRPIFLNLAATLLLMPLTAIQAQPLYSDLVEIKVVNSRNVYEVYLINKAAVDVTVEVEVELTNMKASIDLPFLTTLRGREERNSFQLRIKNKDEPGRYETIHKYVFGNLDAIHDSTYVYRLPYKTGSAHKVVQGYFGNISHDESSHYAVDFGMPEGTPVHAARDGTVVAFFERSMRGGPHVDFMKLMNYIFIRHNDLTIGAYYHLKQNGALVRIGQQVKRGALIGYSGQTGFTFGPHLHFEVFKATNGSTQATFPLKLETQKGVIENPVEGELHVAQ